MPESPLNITGVGVTKAISSIPLFSQLYRYYPPNTVYQLNITFIFDRNHSSLAAVTPVKYECDSKRPRDNYTKSKIYITEKLKNGALVTPTPDHLSNELIAQRASNVDL